MRIYWDLSRCPANYDFVAALAAGVAAGATEVVFDVSKGFSEMKFPSAEGRRFYENVLIPVCEYVGVPWSEGTKGDIIPPWTNGRVIALDFFKPFKLKCESRGYSTITIRDSIRNKHRNSNRAAWEAVARDMDNCIVIEDAYRVPISLKERADLYAHADMNYGVGNGPFALCYFSDIPYAVFMQDVTHKTLVGLPLRGQFPWATPQQKLIWSDDTEQAIRSNLIYR